MLIFGKICHVLIVSVFLKVFLPFCEFNTMLYSVALEISPKRNGGYRILDEGSACFMRNRDKMRGSCGSVFWKGDISATVQASFIRAVHIMGTGRNGGAYPFAVS